MTASSALRLFVLGAVAIVCMLLLSTSVTASIVSERNTVPVLLTSATNTFLDSPVGDSDHPSIASLLQALQKQTTSTYINSQVDAVKRVIMLAYDEVRK